MNRLPALASTCLALLCLAPGAGAASFTVNSNADVPDATPGNGVCNPVLAIPGVCTLRAAIMEANALPGNDSITLTAGQTYTLSRPGVDDTALNGDLDIDGNLSIVFFASGVRPMVDANGMERAFEIHGGNVTLLGFDITGGDATLSGDASGGGIAVHFGAGVVQLSLLRIHGNRARFGGGLYNDGGQTTLSASQLFDNRYGGAIGEDRAGSAIRNRGVLTVQASAIYSNEGFNGGGATTVDVEPGGPGIGRLTLINSTVSDNLGPGVYSTDAESIVLRNSTLAGNSGVGLRFGGVNTSLVMRNTLIARNNLGGALGDCQLSQAASASYNTDRYNLDSDGSCDLEGGSSNLPDTDPLLTPLKRRGGLSLLHWPRPDSPVIDAGHPVIGAIGCEDDDQHFLDRPQDFASAPDDNCDIGAAEVPADAIFFDSHETL